MKLGRLAATTAFVAACHASTAHAQRPAGPAADPAAAEAAFAEARTLIRAGKYAEACPKLEASFALDPALGTLLNLGDCFERTGRTASAWVRYREAAAMAVQNNQREREAIARQRVATLEPRLCRLVVRAHADERPDLEVLRDGALVARAAIGLPVPVDPGAHVIEARAPGKNPFSTRVEIKAPDGNVACAQTIVDIPLLEPERGAGAGTVPLKPIDLGPETSARPTPTPDTPSRWGAMHTSAVVAAAGGLVSLGIGTVFALNASSTNSDAEAKCTSAGCSSEGKSLLADAGKSADIATVTFIVGAALVTTGAVLWLTSPSLRPAAAALRDLGVGSIRF